MLSIKRKLALWIVGLLFVIFLIGCIPTQETSSLGSYSVDQTFSDFYKEFGALETLGPAISPSFINDGVTYQYVVAGLMAYDPSEKPIRRFFFSPIASIEFHINGPIEQAPQTSDIHYVNGHQIWEEVWSLYDQYGSENMGLPVTGVIANDTKQRYEQYFEGLGFYRNYSDPPGQIHLMPYGHWMCGDDCQYQLPDSAAPKPSYSRDYSATEQLFLQTSSQLGYGLTGAPLVAPKLGSDGNYEMVFENVVMYLDATAGSQIKLRPLPIWLGIKIDTPRSVINADWLSFYQTQDGLGYNIPRSFVDYINVHGSPDFVGNPITEYHSLADGGYSQCFTNLCLEYHPTAPRDLQIRPHSLGYDYLNAGTNSTLPGSDILDALQIDVWEDYPLIALGQNQTINITITRNEVPVSGIEFSLVIYQPDGITKTYTLQPTNDHGRTSLEIAPIDGPNGAIVQYEVCVVGAVSPQVCFSRNYTIWDQ